METYIITDEDGIHYITNEITNTEIQARKNYELSIIRCSDYYVMDMNGNWKPLESWLMK